MNILPSIIKSILSSEHLSCVNVEVCRDEFHLFLAQTLDEKHLGTEIKIAFKETEVILLKENINSSANIANAIIQKIEQGLVLTQVSLLYGTFEIKSLISTLSFNRLHVSQGDTITWMVQPSEISLLWSHDGI